MTEIPVLPSGTVTFLFTDVEGSTRLLKLVGDEYGEVLTAHQSILRAAFAASDGYEIDTQGDSFFVAFRRAKDAVAAALDAQLNLARHPWPEGAELRVRMGIHTGEPVVGPSRYVGLAVPRAARVMAAGHGGQILLTNATRELVEDDLRDGVSFRDLGEHWLKDLDRREHIFQVVAEGLISELPPLRTEEAPTAYTGLEGELAAAAQAIVAPPRAPRRLLRPGIAAGVVLVAAASVVILHGSRDSAHAHLRNEPDSAVALSASSGKRGSAVGVGSGPVRAAAGYGSIWVANGNSGTVSRIDPHTRAVIQTIDLGCNPAGIAVGAGSAWVTCPYDGRLSRISVDTNDVVQKISLRGPVGIAFGAGAVWVATLDDRSLTRVNPMTGKPVKTIPIGGTPTAVAVGERSVWVSSESGSSVLRVDPATDTVTASINVGNAPQAIAVGLGSVWVANTLDGTVTRIDAATARPIGLWQVGEGPRDIAVSHGKVWVANEFSGTVSRLDPNNASATTETATGNRPTGLAVMDDAVWVSVRPSGAAHRGGTFTFATASTPIDWLDPAKSYNAEAWQILELTNDGLTSFRRAGGIEGRTIVPDLATDSPTPTDNGKTYTFTVRHGIRYSTGALVKPEDIRFALERDFELSSPGRGYYSEIVGAAACKPNHRCDLSRGVAVNGQTIVFHLTAADPDFLQRLALPFAFAVPSTTPPRPSRTRPFPATGPYTIVHYDPQKRLVLKRNPHFRVWSRTARPDGFPDSIVMKIGVSPDAAVTAVERGHLDYAPGLRASRLSEVSTRYPAQLHVNALPATNYLVLNNRIPPFDSPDARRAINYAIDREEMNRRAGFTQVSVPTCQMLPPNLPGYGPYCPYTLLPSSAGKWRAPDLDRARSLLVRSHTRRQRVTVVGETSQSGRRVARYLVELLTRLGYRATSTAIPYDQLSASGFFGGRRATMNIALGQWIADYPAAGAFLEPQLSCHGSANDSGFCDPAIDEKMREATVLQSTDSRAGDAAWARIDREVVDAAALVPYSNSKEVDFVSKRVGNFQYNPQWAMMFDQLWVTN